MRLLATTDLHARLRGFDYASGRSDRASGLSRAASLIGQLRDAAPGAVLLDNGDFLTGGMIGDQALEEAARGGALPNPVIAAMNALGYEAAALGNHEFNHGIGPLLGATAQAAFPILSANVATALGPDPRGDAFLTRAWTMIERTARDSDGVLRPLRIGIVGFTPPQIMQWDRRHLEGRIVARGIVEAARAWIPAIRAAGADLVVALCHSGIATPDAQADESENAGLALARAGGIDALVLGHRHRVFPGPDYPASAEVDPGRGTIAGVPSVMPGCWGRQVGCIDLALDWDGAAWRVAGATASCHPVAARQRDGSAPASVVPDPRIVRITEPAHRRCLALTRRPVGRIDAPLTSYFARIGRSRAVELVARAQRFCVERMLQGTADAELPVIGIAAPMRCGGRGGPANYVDIPAGEVTEGQVAGLYAFENRVAALRVSGAALHDWLERSVSAFHRIAPGATDARLTDLRFPGFDFDMAERVRFVVDLSRPARYGPRGELVEPAARRLRDLRFLGGRVQANDTFMLAVSEFRALGGGGFPSTGRDRLAQLSRTSVRDAIAELLREGQTKGLGARAFDFHPMPNTSVCLSTGPGAAAHLRDLSDLATSGAEATISGFARIRLDLAGAALATIDADR